MRSFVVTMIFLAAGTGPVWADAMGPAKVIDGDTIAIGERTFDLADIDAPEIGQMCADGSRLLDCGLVAITQLMDLTAGTDVTCEAVSGGARCHAGGYELSEGMIYTGWAVESPVSGGRFNELLSAARTAGRGLWRLEFIAPWDWRTGQRLPREK